MHAPPAPLLIILRVVIVSPSLALCLSPSYRFKPKRLIWAYVAFPATPRGRVPSREIEQILPRFPICSKLRESTTNWQRRARESPAIEALDLALVRRARERRLVVAFARTNSSPHCHEAPKNDFEDVVPCVRGHERFQNAEQGNPQVAERPCRVKPRKVHAQNFNRRRSIPLRGNSVLPEAEGHRGAAQRRFHVIHVCAIVLVQPRPLQQHVQVAMASQREQHLVRQQERNFRGLLPMAFRVPHADLSHELLRPEGALLELCFQTSGRVRTARVPLNVAQAQVPPCDRIVRQRLYLFGRQCISLHERLQVRAQALQRRQRPAVNGRLALGQHLGARASRFASVFASSKKRLRRIATS